MKVLEANALLLKTDGATFQTARLHNTSVMDVARLATPWSAICVLPYVMSIVGLRMCALPSKNDDPS